MERPEWHAQFLSAEFEVKMNRALAAFALLSAGVLSACQTTQVGGDGGSSSKYSRVVARDLQGGFMPNETLEFWPAVVPGSRCPPPEWASTPYPGANIPISAGASLSSCFLVVKRGSLAAAGIPSVERHFAT